MFDKKLKSFESPNLSTLQAVVIDQKTTIYIDMALDPDEARDRYLEKIHRKNTRV